MKDFWIEIGLTALFTLLREKKELGKYRAALRKLFMSLWANRLSFLSQADLESMGLPVRSDD